MSACTQGSQIQQISVRFGRIDWVQFLKIGRFPPNSADLAEKSAKIRWKPGIDGDRFFPPHRILEPCLHHQDTVLPNQSKLPVEISGQLLLDPEPLLPNLRRGVWLHPSEARKWMIPPNVTGSEKKVYNNKCATHNSFLHNVFNDFYIIFWYNICKKELWY